MYRCPRCFTSKVSSQGRTCEYCHYRGDWIQPGHFHLYKCPAFCEIKSMESADHPACECFDLAEQYNEKRSVA